MARAPGRVSIIGGHVDYNDGFVLPAAVDREVAVAFRRIGEPELRVVAADFGEEGRLSLDPETSGGAGVFQGKSGEWAPYIRGVAALLREAGIAVPGAELAIAGDVPVGAGLSSSAALEVAVARALLAVAGGEMPPLEVAMLCRRAEVEFAGVRCGIMDQFASVFGRAGHAIFLDCRSLEHRHVPIPGEVRLVATDSGARRMLGDSAFNEGPAECAEAARRLGVTALRDVPVSELDAVESDLPEPLRRRVRHVVGEIERTRRAAAALEEGDMEGVGRLMVESHASSRDNYRVSSPELNVLVEAALQMDGVYGSRLTGAGFGGCTVSLVAAGAVPAFLQEVPAAYRRATGRDAEVHVLEAGSGASVDFGAPRARAPGPRPRS